MTQAAVVEEHVDRKKDWNIIEKLVDKLDENSKTEKFGQRNWIKKGVRLYPGDLNADSYLILT